MNIAEYAEATINAAINSTQIDQCRLHSGPPGQSNDNEIKSAGYVRQNCTFKLAIPGDQGRRYLAQEVNFNLSADDKVSWISFWYMGAFVQAHKLPVERAFLVGGNGKLTTATYISSRGLINA